MQAAVAPQWDQVAALSAVPALAVALAPDRPRPDRVARRRQGRARAEHRRPPARPAAPPSARPPSRQPAVLSALPRQTSLGARSWRAPRRPASPRAAAPRAWWPLVSLYNDAAGHPCRVVEQTVMINGSPVRAR